ARQRGSGQGCTAGHSTHKQQARRNQPFFDLPCHLT
ncbi:MAG: hypothetical protein ACI8W7_003762, partial [Gammaproteobacteria bacterium]